MKGLLGLPSVSVPLQVCAHFLLILRGRCVRRDKNFEVCYLWFVILMYRYLKSFTRLCWPLFAPNELHTLLISLRLGVAGTHVAGTVWPALLDASDRFLGLSEIPGAHRRPAGATLAGCFEKQQKNCRVFAARDAHDIAMVVLLHLEVMFSLMKILQGQLLQVLRFGPWVRWSTSA